MALNDNKILQNALLLGVEAATIKAVAKVEGGGAGLIGGRPVILFEPHIFYRLRRQAGTIPAICDICYPVWGTKPYPKGQDAQWKTLDSAIKINRELALRSTSWGMFQVLGNNFKEAGCKSVQDFVNANFAGEDRQLELFLSYIVSVNLLDELREKDWKMFARQYNGVYYYRNNYDKKLETAYNSFVT
jgi:hypothetical protein